MIARKASLRSAGLTVIGTLLLAMSVETASAALARVYSNTNLRQGPGTNFGIIATVPGGSIVDIRQCAADWCTAHWRGRVGYMIASNLDLHSGPVAPPVVVYSSPPPMVYGPPYLYYGPRYYMGPRYRHWRRW